MHFGENQLSRSLIGLSPLTTGHPPGFQPWWVRSSTKSYLRFNLPMARSLRFGSWARYSTALFGLAFATATPHGLTSQHTANSQAHSSKGTQSRPPRKLDGDAPTACRHTVSGTISLRSRGTFHHSLTVLSAIGHQGIFRLSGWSRQIHTRFLEPHATRDILPTSRTDFVYGGLTLYAGPFTCPSTTHTVSHSPTSRQTSPENSHNPD